MQRLFSAALFVALVTLILGCGGAGSSVKPGAKVWTRTDLENAVAGKTPDQVIQILGPPKSTYGDIQRTGEGDFTYWEILNNPYTGKTDGATLVFFNGKCVRLR
jgi:hypothetical protein